MTASDHENGDHENGDHENGALPLYRSVHMVAVLRRFALGAGMTTEALLEGNSLRQKDLEDPDFLVTTSQEMGMIRMLTRVIGRPGVGLEVGQGYHAGSIGPLGIAMLHCENLGEAVEVAHEFQELIASYYRLDVTISRGRVAISMPEIIDLGDTREFICEREVAALVRIISDLAGRHLAPIDAEIAYRAPAHHGLYEQALGCPVRFGTGAHRLVFDAAVLGDPLPLANPLSRQTYVRDCRVALVRRRGHGSVAQRATQEILYRQQGIPDLDSMADRLHMSPRTFRRRLHAEGTTYRGVVADVQRSEAIRLLRDTDLPIARIADDVGYGDLPNFYRAFRRWTGTTPAAFRRGSRPLDGASVSSTHAE
ncbi:AraC family transcriptional regulator [Gordonia sp. NPDC003376]